MVETCWGSTCRSGIGQDEQKGAPRQAAGMRNTARGMAEKWLLAVLYFFLNRH